MEDLRLSTKGVLWSNNPYFIPSPQAEKKNISEQNGFMHNKVKENSPLYRSVKGPHHAQNHSG
jgi:hypothetical protein